MMDDVAPVLPRVRLLVPTLLALGVLVTGCGQEEQPPPTDGAPPIGTAADALSCAEGLGTQADSGGTAGPEGLADGPEAALERWLETSPDAPDLDPDEFGVAVEEVGTVLLTHEVDGEPVVAVVTSDAMRTADGDTGWAVRGWARCSGAPGP